MIPLRKLWSSLGSFVSCWPDSFIWKSKNINRLRKIFLQKKKWCHNHPRHLYIRKYFAIWRFYMNIQLTVNSRSARVKNNRGNFTLGLSPCLTGLAKLVSLSVPCCRWGDSLSPVDVGSCPSLALPSSSSWFPLCIDCVVCSRRIPLVSCCSPFAVPMYEQIAFSNLHLCTWSMCVLLRWILRRIIKRWFPGSIILKV